MKAARLHAYGDVEHFKYEDVADPVPGAGEILIKVEATSLNPVELYLRQGYLTKMIPLELPAILGIDVAGTVGQVGPGVIGFSSGDRVIGKLAINGKGAQAELTVATENQLAKLADNVSFSAGATLPLVGLTGRQGVDALGVKTGDRVLVTGALGAVGRAAVQYLNELGAVPLAGVRKERLAEARALTGEALMIGERGESASFAAALDTIGGPVAATAIDLVRDGGVLGTVAGMPEGAMPDFG